MRNTTKLLAFCGALLLGLIAIPLAIGQTDGPQPAEPDKNDAILAQLKELKNSVQDLEKRLKSTGDEMDKKLKAYVENPDTNTQLRLARLQADTDSLRKQMDQLQKDLLAMNDR